MKLFKDSYNVTHKTTQRKAFAELLDIVNKGELKEVLLSPLTVVHTPDHSLCDYKNSDSNKNTEKRMCRCMFYHNQNNPEQIEKCKKCKYAHKWLHNKTDGYSITEYEYPSKYKMDKIGGVDLIINDGNKKYAVEMKPSSSDETICRMVSEIITYTLDENFKDCIPAIGFFDKDYVNNKEQSIQKKQYLALQNNEDFKNVISIMNIAIFEFSIDSEKSKTGEKNFSIKRFN